VFCTVQSLFQGTVEPFHHTGFRVTAGRKMMNAFLFHQLLKRLLLKFFSVICLKIDGFSTSFQDLSHRIGHRFACLGLHGLNPGMFRKHVRHRQESNTLDYTWQC